MAMAASYGHGATRIVSVIMAGVSLQKLRKSYENGHVAVHEASFDVADGELLVLVGPSGCGKSTLLRMIAGLESISAGTLRIDGEVVNDLEPKARDIAMVFQSYALYPHMTVAENLAFGLKLRGLPKSEVAERIQKAAQMLGLEAMLQRLPKELSGGQRQRVALGRALVRQPKVFLLDEPLSNLDARLRLSMRTEISRLHRALGATMIYVTHDQIEAMTLGQRIVVLKDGVIQQIDKPMALYARPANVFVAGFLGSPAMNLLRGRLELGETAQFHVSDQVIRLGAGARLPESLRKTAGSELILGLRPEHLTPQPDATAAAGFEALIDTIEPVGNEVFLNLSVGTAQLVARLPPQTLPDPGDRIRLAFDPAQLHWFDAQTELRMDGIVR
jgi:multiple sugar transport system ATP-binding protein